MVHRIGVMKLLTYKVGFWLLHLWMAMLIRYLAGVNRKGRW
jgi:hypothetical protein